MIDMICDDPKLLTEFLQREADEQAACCHVFAPERPQSALRELEPEHQSELREIGATLLDELRALPECDDMLDEPRVRLRVDHDLITIGNVEITVKTDDLQIRELGNGRVRISKSVPKRIEWLRTALDVSETTNSRLMHHVEMLERLLGKANAVIGEFQAKEAARRKRQLLR